nr:hypothetical protein [uncultured Sphingorhabdus sp.]
MRLIIAPLLLLMLPSLATADDADYGDAQQSAPPERISFLVTFGDERCPEAQGDEIVVCAAQPEGDRYRIPKKLRETDDVAVGGGSWTSAVESLDGYSRAVLPNSCSVNGSAGFTGCTQQLLQRWFAERRGQRDAN